MVCKQLWMARSRVIRPALLLAIVLGLTGSIVQSKTFTVLHSFTGGGGRHQIPWQVSAWIR